MSENSAEHFYQQAFNASKAFAFWKWPYSAKVEAIAGTHELKRPSPEHDSGFLLAPFDLDQEPVFITAEHTFEAALTEQQKPIESGEWYPNPDRSQHYSTQADYEALVAQGVQEIDAGHMEKVVLAHASATPLPQGFHPLAFFQSLCTRYEEAFVSLVAIPGKGTWVGATPELLLQADEERLKTVALAGTRTDDHPWTNKELEEQALVRDYIIETFQKAGVQDLYMSGNRDIKAGDLLHIYTEFSCRRIGDEWWPLVNSLLAQLHPTPAVGGMSRTAALNFIQEQEPLKRRFYSGYLGQIKAGQFLRLQVNLRCLELLESEAICYAGAGITRDSEPKAEWQETQNKLETLRSVLGDTKE